jgi:predicted permease
MMRLFRRLQYLLHRGRRDKELAEEMASHRALAEQEQRDSGLDPEEARLAARRRMGNETLARESAYHVWFPAAVEGVIQDLRYAWRGLMRSKVLLAVGCLSLGLSTGFGTALFSVVNAVILQPVTAERPESLVRLWVGTGNRISGANLRDLCEDTPGVSCAGYRVDETVWDNGGEPERVFASLVSPHYFEMLGIEAARGRRFTKDSVRENRDIAVVTHAFWERRLASDPGVIGRRLQLMGRSYTVTGVLPRGFRSIWGLGISPSVYLPAGSMARASTAGRGDAEYEMLGLLAPGQSLAEFRSRVLSRAKGLEAAYPVENRDLARVQTFPFHRFGLLLASDKSMTQVLLLFASLIVVFVLLLAVVACLNVAGLLVARALSRQREIAIRLSIGCGRLRLARLLLAESLLLALLGIGAGAVLSVWLARLLVLTPLPFPIPFEAEVPVDTHLLAFLTVLAGLATVVAGIAPAMQAWRFPAAGAATASRSPGTRRWPLRALLIAGQVAVSTVLVVGTTLFVRSLWVAGRVHPGFDLDRVVTVEADTRSRQLSDADAATYYREAVARVKTLPGVTAVSGALVVPLSMASIVNSVLVDRGTSEQTVTVNSNRVLPDYFRAMGIPLRAGREFADSDRLAQPRAAIVNETFARQLFPGENAIGKRVRRPVSKGDPEPWAEIVGVAADSRYLTLGEETRPQVYWPLGPAVTSMTLHVRTEGDSGALARAIPEALAAVDFRMRAKAKPLRAVMAVALFPAQAAAAMLAALGTVGWALTICGLYGLVAYMVTRRVPEIGIRVALGATPSRVIGLLLRDGLVVSFAGLAAGLAIAALATPFLGMFLAGVPPRDSASFALAAALLLATALAASYFPARRGTKLAPAEALRAE